MGVGPTCLLFLVVDLSSSNLPPNYSSFRHYIGQLREESLLYKVRSLVSAVHSNGFKVLSLEPQVKDGGVFVKFQYKGGSDHDAVLDSILFDLREAAAKHGGVPSWSGLRKGDIWLVKGSPWREVGIITLTTHKFHED